MSSPQRISPQRIVVEHLLESQVRHRSRFTENTSDFYQLKLHRLEHDFTVMQEELNLARIRLRTAEDFEIKYELLTKQNSSLLHENGRLVKQLGIRKIETERLLEEIRIIALEKEDLLAIIAARDAQILLLVQRIKQFQIQTQQLAIRASRANDGQLTTLKKTNQQLEQMLNSYQTTSNLKGQQLAGEIEKLNNQIRNLQDELDRQSRRHADELARMGRELEGRQHDYERKLVQERERLEDYKSQVGLELEKTRREKGQGGSDEEVGVMAQEISSLTSLLKDKEEELFVSIEEKNLSIEGWNRERDQLRRHIRLLEEKLYQRERQNELQLLNLRERLAKLHAEQISQLKRNEEDLLRALKELKPEDLLKVKDSEIIQLNQKIYSDKNLHQRDRQEILKGIDTLKDRIREHNAHADNQHKILTSLNLNIEEERTSKQTDYQSNLTFLDQQLKKANLTIEQKNLEIKKLLNELNDLKLDTEKDRKQMLLRAEGERKQLNKDIDQLLEERQVKEEELKRREKQLKVKDRELEEQEAKNAAEKKAHDRLEEELQNDCRRMADELKLIERVVRDERQRNIGSVTQLNNLRRQKMGDLDRQKEEFELLYRGRMDQLKDSLNLEIDKLRVERDRLQAELTHCRLQLTESQQDFKKVSSLVAQQSKVNKQKLVEYQKKMATLNQEISMTQNLYNSFMDAKSRLKQSRNQKEN